jgi:hypothetical protein
MITRRVAQALADERAERGCGCVSACCEQGANVGTARPTESFGLGPRASRSLGPAEEGCDTPR